MRDDGSKFASRNEMNIDDVKSPCISLSQASDLIITLGLIKMISFWGAEARLSGAWHSCQLR